LNKVGVTDIRQKKNYILIGTTLKQIDFLILNIGGKSSLKNVFAQKNTFY